MNGDTERMDGKVPDRSVEEEELPLLLSVEWAARITGRGTLVAGDPALLDDTMSGASERTWPARRTGIPCWMCLWVCW